MAPSPKTERTLIIKVTVIIVAAMIAGLVLLACSPRQPSPSDTETSSITANEPADNSVTIPAATTPPTESQPLETGKGRLVLDGLIAVPETIGARKIIDDFLIGVGTTDPQGSVSSTFLQELRQNGLNYFLPFASWASGGITSPSGDTIAWLDISGATLNGHCLIFLYDQPWTVPRSVFNLSFEEQTTRLEQFVRNVVVSYPEIEIWTLNEPVAQNCFGWTREQIYDTFVAAAGWIHDTNPQARVLINMIPIECNWGGLDYEPTQVADDLFQRGLEADIIGIELYYWWAPEEQRDACGYPELDWVKSQVDIFREYDLPILFTEVGVPGEIEGREQFQSQADWMEAFFRFCHDDEDIIGATWYFVRDDSFMPTAGLANNDYTHRPVGKRLLELADSWNPLVTYSINGTDYLDLEPGEYDIIITPDSSLQPQIYRVSLAPDEVVHLSDYN